MQHRHDEFSLHLRWRSPHRDSHPRPKVEGFYLSAGFANEGEADWLLDEEPVTLEQLQHLLTDVGQRLECPALVYEGTALRRAAERHLRDELARAELAVTHAQARLDALRAASSLPPVPEDGG